MVMTSQDVVGVVCGLIDVGVMFGILTAYAKAGLWMQSRVGMKILYRKAYLTLIYGTVTLVLSMVLVPLFTGLVVVGVLPKTFYLPIAVVAMAVSLVLMYLHLWVVRQCHQSLN